MLLICGIAGIAGIAGAAAALVILHNKLRAPPVRQRAGARHPPGRIALAFGSAQVLVDRVLRGRRRSLVRG